MTAPATGRLHAAIIANEASGSSLDDGELRASFDAVDADTSWLPTSEESPGTEQARQAVDDGADVVVACGGDGTVRAVLEGVAGSDTVLSIVPLGTGNLLASNLGLPKGLEAVPLTAGDHTRTLDVGIVNGERFAVMAGAGLDAAMVGDADPDLKRRVGTVAYVLAALGHLRGLRSRMFRAEITVDGEAGWSGRTVMVLVGNCGTVSGGLEVFPDAEPDDGVLDVAVLTASRLREWGSVLWRLVWSKPQRPELVTRRRGRHVQVRFDRPVRYELDGEVRPAARELDVSVEPQALVVRVPAPPT